ncbi:hypothetical protein AMATHDRAFT_186029 [Amanita thiersii Skay4041]|uniref:Ubiquitin thioesterase OTU n=1 Tax=Amanita thiersii Skay4041 TaxID=703135 RepID=A0A2A9NZY8_9AGAR|nr:hypothetical protein AMATHDRAFT_186029 [Amanita thiersii Skay4041]
MAPLRIRHPKGASTLQIALDDDTCTVQHLQQQIHSLTNILPSRQLLKAGYPPRSLTLVPELPISSLGITSGDQIIVNEVADPTTPQSASLRAPVSVSLPKPPRVPIRPSNNTMGQAFAGISTQELIHVEMDGGSLIHRVVPDDNSCLFSAVALIFEQSISEAQRIRQIVAEGIQKDPTTYNEAILGMPPESYIATIKKPTTWGGAIELGILAAHYQTEIASIDVETGRIDKFSPPFGGSAMRCVLIYSGIHYDAATMAPMPDAPSEWHQTVFPISSMDDKIDPVLIAASKLADVLRAKKAYTNTATFDLKCQDCGTGLKGEKEARVHAEQTGHVHFGEY